MDELKNEHELIVSLHDIDVGVLKKRDGKYRYEFEYIQGYEGPPISVAMPTSQDVWPFDQTPPVFDGLLPEGYNLDVLLRRGKLDADDIMGQLEAIGSDTVGAITLRVRP